MEATRSEIDTYARCPRNASICLSCGREFGMVLGSLDPGTSLEVGEGSRCSHPGKMRVVAAAELIFGFMCLSLVRREKLQPARWSWPSWCLAPISLRTRACSRWCEPKPDRQTDQVLLAERAGTVSPSAADSSHLMRQVALLLSPDSLAKFPGVGEVVWHFAWFSSSYSLFWPQAATATPALVTAAGCAHFSTRSFSRSFLPCCYFWHWFKKSNPGAGLQAATAEPDRSKKEEERICKQ